MLHRSAGAGRLALCFSFYLQPRRSNGRFLREWKLGHPFSLFVTPNHFIYMADAIAKRAAF
jgi:hypothetical protein